MEQPQDILHLIDARPLCKTNVRSTNQYLKALLAEVIVLQPDGGDDQEDGEADHEEVEDEDAGEGGGQHVKHPREAEMSSLSLAKSG